MKFINVAMKKYLSASNLYAIVLDSSKYEKTKINTCNSNLSLANIEEIDSDISIIEDNQKYKVIQYIRLLQKLGLESSNKAIKFLFVIYIILH